MFKRKKNKFETFEKNYQKTRERRALNNKGGNENLLFHFICISTHSFRMLATKYNNANKYPSIKVLQHLFVTLHSNIGRKRLQHLINGRLQYFSSDINVFDVVKEQWLPSLVI
jgi:hypothetical protein